jgi:hypothetical protein
MFLAHKVVPSSGSTAISTFGPDLLADEQYRRFIHLAFTDHDGTIDRKAA